MLQNRCFSLMTMISKILKYSNRSLVIALLTLAGLPALRAQDEVEYKMEIGGGIGVNNAINDLNSSLFGAMGLTGNGTLRFVLNPRMAVKTALSYCAWSDNTKGLKAFYPASETGASAERLNYSMKGGVIDLSALYELHFLPYGYVQGYQGYKRLVPYIQMGLGFTYSDIGKAFTMNVPFGLGLKYKAAPRLNLGLEWRMHFSLSDKLDGLQAPLGITSSGFRNKDHYGMALFTITYDISAICPACNKD